MFSGGLPITPYEDGLIKASYIVRSKNKIMVLHEAAESYVWIFVDATCIRIYIVTINLISNEYKPNFSHWMNLSD